MTVFVKQAMCGSNSSSSTYHKSREINIWINNLVFDQLDLVTYEEVVKQENFRRKTLVLLGKVVFHFYSIEKILQFGANM